MNRKTVSDEQMFVIVEFMERNGDIAQFVKTVEGKVRRKRLWEELTASLSHMGGGANKSSDKWMKTWSDMKHRVKKKMSVIIQDTTGTGGGPRTGEPLSPLERRIYNIIGKRAVFGGNVTEGGLYPANNVPEVEVEFEINNQENIPPSTSQYSIPSSATQCSIPPSATQCSIPPPATQSSIPPSATQSSIPPSATQSSIPPSATQSSIPPTQDVITPAGSQRKRRRQVEMDKWSSSDEPRHSFSQHTGRRRRRYAQGSYVTALNSLAKIEERRLKIEEKRLEIEEKRLQIEQENITKKLELENKFLLFLNEIKPSLTAFLNK